MTTISSRKDREFKAELLAEIGIGEPWALVKQFGRLTLLSGSVKEAVAVACITDHLTAFPSPKGRNRLEDSRTSRKGQSNADD